MATNLMTAREAESYTGSHPLAQDPTTASDEILHRAVVIIVWGGDGSRPTAHGQTFVDEFYRRGMTL